MWWPEERGVREERSVVSFTPVIKDRLHTFYLGSEGLLAFGGAGPALSGAAVANVRKKAMAAWTQDDPLEDVGLWADGNKRKSFGGFGGLVVFGGEKGAAKTTVPRKRHAPIIPAVQGLWTTAPLQLAGSAPFEEVSGIVGFSGEDVSRAMRLLLELDEHDMAMRADQRDQPKEAYQRGWRAFKDRHFPESESFAVNGVSFSFPSALLITDAAELHRSVRPILASQLSEFARPEKTSTDNGSIEPEDDEESTEEEEDYAGSLGMGPPHRPREHTVAFGGRPAGWYELPHGGIAVRTEGDDVWSLRVHLSSNGECDLVVARRAGILSLEALAGRALVPNFVPLKRLPSGIQRGVTTSYLGSLVRDLDVSSFDEFSRRIVEEGDPTASQWLSGLPASARSFLLMRALDSVEVDVLLRLLQLSFYQLHRAHLEDLLSVGSQHLYPPQGRLLGLLGPLLGQAQALQLGDSYLADVWKNHRMELDAMRLLLDLAPSPPPPYSAVVSMYMAWIQMLSLNTTFQGGETSSTRLQRVHLLLTSCPLESLVPPPSKPSGETSMGPSLFGDDRSSLFHRMLLDSLRLSEAHAAEILELLRMFIGRLPGGRLTAVSAPIEDRIEKAPCDLLVQFFCQSFLSEEMAAATNKIQPPSTDQEKLEAAEASVRRLVQQTKDVLAVLLEAGAPPPTPCDLAEYFEEDASWQEVQDRLSPFSREDLAQSTHSEWTGAAAQALASPEGFLSLLRGVFGRMERGGQDDSREEWKLSLPLRLSEEDRPFYGIRLPRMTAIDAPTSTVIAASKDDAMLGYAVIGSIFNALEGAYCDDADARRSWLTGQREILPQAQGTVLAVDCTMKVPVLPGRWFGAPLVNPHVGRPHGTAFGAIWWHESVGDGAQVQAGVQLVRELCGAGDPMANVPSQEQRALGWRLIGRYAWDYYRRWEGASALPPERQLPSADELGTAGPSCVFCSADAYVRDVVPALQAGFAQTRAQRQPKCTVDPQMGEGYVVLGHGVPGLYTMPFGDSGASLASMWHQEYQFAALRFTGSPRGSAGADAFLCYSYAMPNDLLDCWISNTFLSSK